MTIEPQPVFTDAASPDGNRVAHRHKVFVPARMITPQGDLRVHLINISTTGALAHHESPPAAQTIVGVEIDGRTIGGRIVWINGRRFGVAFSAPLDERRLDSLFNGLAVRGSARRPEALSR